MRHRVLEFIASYLGVVYIVCVTLRPAATWRGALWTPAWLALVIGAAILGGPVLLVSRLFERRVPR